MNISAKIITDSIANDIRITTMELCYPRFIHSEFMTHRMFSRNAASSRAIPIEKMLKQVEENPAMPIHWGKNQPGMQAGDECNELVFINYDKTDTYYHTREDAWRLLAHLSRKFAENFASSGYHKQVVNRLLEPFQWMKVIVTATEWDNFFKLRLHPDAQPEIRELAKCMRVAMDNSIPQELQVGKWHLPYVNLDELGINFTRGAAIKCSVARCARVSYLNHDSTSPNITKDIALADKLLEAGHFSPFEHQATPMQDNKGSESPYYTWEEGITHQDKYGKHWSGNFKGFLQYRQLLAAK